MTPTTLTNVSAGQTFTPVHRRCRASVPSAAVNMPPASVQALTKLVLVGRPPELPLALGEGQQNTHLVKNAAPTPARLVQNPSPALAARTKSKSQQPNVDLPAILANLQELTYILISALQDMLFLRHFVLMDLILLLVLLFIVLVAKVQ